MSAMNTTRTSVAVDSQNIASQLNIYLGLFFWLFGNLGCVGNILVFSSRRLRQRAYAIYLLAEALSNLIYFNFLLLTRILQRGFHIPITTHSSALCKLRQFDSVWNHVVSLTFFSLATIDRILSLQRANKYRRCSNRIDVARKMCIVFPLFWLLCFGHRLVLYDVINGRCVPQSGLYASIDSYLEAGLTAMATPVMMIVFGCLLLRSVYDVTHRKVVPHDGRTAVTIVHRPAFRHVDSRLTLMLLFQVLVALVTRLPYAGEVIYSNMTQTWPKSVLWMTIENVLIELIRLLSYAFLTTSFYISWLSNPGFRRQLGSCFKKPSAVSFTVTLNA